jgi:AraC-like DNA-binding protein
VYLATVHSGIIEVDPAQSKVLYHQFEDKQVPFSNILVDEGGHVWAGTINDGLYVLDQSQKSLMKVDLIKGLDSQSVTNLIQSSDGEIWLTTASEIISFRCLGGGAVDVTRYISAEEIDFCSNTGVFFGQMLLLGTTDGIFAMELDKLNQIPFYSGNLVVTDVILNGVPYSDKNINNLDKLYVREGDNVQIRYTLLDYNSPMSPIYTCSYGDVRYETAENSIAFTVTQSETLVSISNEMSGECIQIRIVAEDDSHVWIYLAVGGVIVLVAVGVIWKIRRTRSRKGTDKDVISFEINSIKFESADQQLLSQAMDVIHRNISNADFKQDDFIKEMGMSRTLLTDKLKELTGFTPISLILEVRLKTAYNTIMEATDKLRVSDIAYSVGFNDAKYFSTCFRKRYGITPKDLMSQRMESVSDKKEN